MSETRRAVSNGRGANRKRPIPDGFFLIHGSKPSVRSGVLSEWRVGGNEDCRWA